MHLSRRPPTRRLLTRSARASCKISAFPARPRNRRIRRRARPRARERRFVRMWRRRTPSRKRPRGLGGKLELVRRQGLGLHRPQLRPPFRFRAARQRRHRSAPSRPPPSRSRCPARRPCPCRRPVQPRHSRLRVSASPPSCHGFLPPWFWRAGPCSGCGGDGRARRWPAYRSTSCSKSPSRCPIRGHQRGHRRRRLSPLHQRGSPLRRCQNPQLRRPTGLSLRACGRRLKLGCSRCAASSKRTG